MEKYMQIHGLGINKRRFSALLTLVIVVYATVSMASEIRPDNPVRCRNEVSMGAGMSIFQMGFAMQPLQHLDISYARRFTRNISAVCGIRYYKESGFPAGFARFSVTQRFGAWEPSAGIEAGVFTPIYTSSSNQLLKETREAMLDEIGRLYLSSHISPLSFALGNHWKISTLDISIGSHARHIGRSVFAQVNFIRFHYSF